MASMDAKDDPSHAKPALPLLLAPAALYLFSVSLLFPVFPSLLKFALPAGVPERGAETTALYGLLQQIKAVLDLFTLPVLGRVSDYVGRKPVTLWCLVLALLQLLLITPPSRTGAAPETYHACLVASRVLGGMSDGVLVLLFASLTDVADGAALPVLFGRVGLVFGCAFTLGPLTAALLLARSGEVAVLLLSACCTLLALLLYAGTRTETLLAARRSRLPTSLTAQFLLYFSPVYQLQQVWANPLLREYLFAFLLHEVSTAVYLSWILYLQWRFLWSAARVGIFLSAIGVVVGVTQGLLLRPTSAALQRWVGETYERAVVGTALAANALHFALLAFVSSGTAWFLLLPLSGLASFAAPVLRGIVMRTQPVGRFGSVNAMFSTCAVLARVFGSAVFPWILARSQEGAVFPGALNLAASAVMLCCLAAAVRATALFPPHLLRPPSRESVVLSPSQSDGEELVGVRTGVDGGESSSAREHASSPGPDPFAGGAGVRRLRTDRTSPV